ncbi:hypothetical protein EOD23_21635 [Mesorhizobium sp. USDA-HM6]|nr:hypothetical protein EOD23_21635 [Mesorhizobium sp. USDA-HM6]
MIPKSVEQLSDDIMLYLFDLGQFQEKCVAVFRPELRKNKYLERFGGETLNRSRTGFRFQVDST